MGKFFDTIPNELIPWVEDQKCFWVATAPLSAKGHVNISPKGLAGTFKIIDEKTFFYQDLTGSGVETASHLRENGRITVLFNAFEGPPRIMRLFGTGKVHEIGSPRYNELIPIDERLPGSRAAIVVDVHKVGTSCGFSVPLYKLEGDRKTLHETSSPLEQVDRSFAADQGKPEFLSHGLKQHWAEANVRSIDGLPGLAFCRDLAGLPQTQVKEDKKVFHIDVEDDKLTVRLGEQTQRFAAKVEQTGFVGGLVVGLAAALAWVTIAGRHR
ncbi:hypothetical protein FRC12_006553 [Ceratobasidium sp. 428]|nr:hypothetical protein FRC12_006553 [Ceratobasidium sp. 428]